MKNTKLNVLSLFDGVGTGYLALNRAGLKIDNYYSSEIDKSALKVQEHHYSANTSFHKIGDVTQLDARDFINIDLVIFGSPCTQLSSVNPIDRSGLDGPDSRLFYEAIRLMNGIMEIQPKGKQLYFLMENVASMSTKNKERITSELQKLFGNSVQLLKINSALVSAANRRRLYWTNIPNVSAPEDEEVVYDDILVSGFADRPKANVLLSTNVTLTNGIFRYYKRNIGNIIFKDKAFADSSTEEKLLSYPFILHKSGYRGRSRAVPNEYEFVNGCYRLPSTLELERMMTFPDGYISRVSGISKTEKRKLIGLSFTVNVISHLLKPLANV